MNIKYDMEQCVLVKATVKGIRVDDDGVWYFLEIPTDAYEYCGKVSVPVKEKQIVCGWVKGGDSE